MNARFPNGDKVVTMSLLQAVVMLLFNSANKLTYAEIKEATKISNYPNHYFLIFILLTFFLKMIRS